MKFFAFALRIVLASMFIFSGLVKLYPIEIFELTFIDLGIASGSSAPFVARLLIGLEILLGGLLLFGIWRQEVLRVSLWLIGAFSIYLIWLLVAKGNGVNCGCFGEQIPMTPVESLIKNSLFAGICAVLIRYDTVFETPKWKKWIGRLVILLSIATPFVLNPVRLVDNTHTSVDPYELDISGIPRHFIEGDSIALSQGEVIVAFFSVTCGHCKNAAYKLTIAEKKYNLPRVVTVFIGKEEKLSRFWEESNSEFPHVFFPDKRVFKITSGKFPTIMYLKDGYVTKQWTGDTFAYSEIEKLKLQ
ncbi:MAG: hypothetical protein JKY42_02435 [Flavobacteriales bacterium]|nr:hypothetical protein [Flavobacteriales bacterium]